MKCLRCGKIVFKGEASCPDCRSEVTERTRSSLKESIGSLALSVVGGTLGGFFTFIVSVRYLISTMPVEPGGLGTLGLLLAAVNVAFIGCILGALVIHPLYRFYRNRKRSALQAK